MDAFAVCESEMQANPKKPASASESAYQDYVYRRDTALAADPKVKDFDASLDPMRDWTPTKLLPVCDKYFADYTSGVGATDLPLSSSCDASYSMRVVTKKLADTRIGPNPKAELTAGQRDQYRRDAGSALYLARFSLEAARYTYFSKFPTATGGARCASNDRFKKAFVPVKQAFDSAEAAVAARETEMGVKVVIAANGTVSYLRLANNQPISNPSDI
jgi:hypothetical protein